MRNGYQYPLRPVSDVLIELVGCSDNVHTTHISARLCDVWTGLETESGSSESLKPWCWPLGEATIVDGAVADCDIWRYAIIHDDNVDVRPVWSIDIQPAHITQDAGAARFSVASP